MADISILFNADDPRLRTAIGTKQGDQILVRGGPAGCALFGPYISLPRGLFHAKVRFAPDEAAKGRVVVEIAAAGGREIVATSRHALSDLTSPEIGLSFALTRPATGCEIRLQCSRDVTATITGAEITYVDRDTSVIEAALASGSAHAVSEQRVLARLDILERLVRGGQGVYVGNNRILMRINAGDADLAFFVPADDRLLTPMNWAHGQHEPDLTHFFLSSVPKAANCLDLGANFGYYTCLMGHLARQGRTIGLEPDPQIYELLRDNIVANSLQQRTSAIHGAVSDRAGRMTLYRRDTRSGNTSIAHLSEDYTRQLGEAPSAPFETDAFAVDDLLPRFDGRIDFIKIDVEGAEPLAFRRMHETLAANPQIRIVMEWSPGQMHAAGFDPAAFVGELAGLGLEAAVIDARGPQPVPLSALTGDAYHSGVLLTKAGAAAPDA